MKHKTFYFILSFVVGMAGCKSPSVTQKNKEEVYEKNAIPIRGKLSAASKRAIERHYEQGPEWFCGFRKQDLKGDFRYEEGVIRRDPSAVILVGDPEPEEVRVRGPVNSVVQEIGDEPVRFGFDDCVVDRCREAVLVARVFSEVKVLLVVGCPKIAVIGEAEDEVGSFLFLQAIPVKLLPYDGSEVHNRVPSLLRRSLMVESPSSILIVSPCATMRRALSTFTPRSSTPMPGRQRCGDLPKFAIR